MCIRDSINPAANLNGWVLLFPRDEGWRQDHFGQKWGLWATRTDSMFNMEEWGHLLLRGHCFGARVQLHCKFQEQWRIGQLDCFFLELVELVVS